MAHARRLNRILCPVDFDPISRNAVRHSLAFADWLQARVDLLHVWDAQSLPPGLTMWISGGEPRLLTELVEEQLEGQMRKLVASLSSEERKRFGEAHVRTGSAVKEILAFAEKEAYPLIVMGTHARSLLPRVVLGSVAEKVVRKAESPVVTVNAELPERELQRIEQILVPTDFSEPSEQALKLAGSIPHAQITLLHVWNYWPLLTGDPLNVEGKGTLMGIHEALLDTARTESSELKRRAVEYGLPVVDAIVDQGDPREVILRHANSGKFQLLSMGTHGRSGLGSLMMGSVTHAVLRHARVPVMTVRPEAHVLPLTQAREAGLDLQGSAV